MSRSSCQWVQDGVSADELFQISSTCFIWVSLALKEVECYLYIFSANTQGKYDPALRGLEPEGDFHCFPSQVWYIWTAFAFPKSHAFHFAKYIVCEFDL